MRSLTNFKRRLQGYKGISARYEKLDLSAANAFGSNWTEVAFEDCDFSGAIFKNAVFDRCQFVRCTGRLADFSTATFTDTGFFDSKLPQASFYASTFYAHLFSNCDLSFAIFADTSSRGLAFPDCNLHGADLRLREALLPVNWTGANLWGVQVAIGCAFFNGTFDSRQLRIFTALAARRHPNGAILDERARLNLVEVAGDELKLVDRLMREQE
jgi:uncharacterized protein YjbI with pentapeptide repeats